MPKVSQEHKDAMRARIRDAAKRCIVRSGFAGASMADIVREAGLSAGAVYVYYSGKEELAIDIAHEVLDSRFAALDLATGAEVLDPPARIVPDLVRGLLVRDGMPSIVVQIWAEGARSESFRALATGVLDRIRTQLGAYLVRWFVQHRGASQQRARADAAALVPGIVAMLQGVIVQFVLAGSAPAEAALDSVAQLLRLTTE
ncbi:TetR/AcrR family transcriptional regulator [Brevibacterium sp. 50QC2O2]|uniref:TetR/AcrR family transcriptional regulator n=1 Tax=Brevibacterium TaxID=1696 RepID=UPI00211B79BE|nr:MULTISPECIES: TetR/AcrR family transcriptional regulator [unclassified Brevibacterium]MCQ9368078.1 TetR/AcrR family transcriptional regulator [Brevibacterium sp. 91QC2O2]MCQ9385280.1 TetR/AcrR family transcriptional regulator [Brevibacterium sp. 68QC2CO]MCQ9388786.1 TetR/AcrR family transcriptional regulator [Brevibacterium sp. 50QC2O2]